MAIATETLHAEKREVVGTRACGLLRAKGLVPAILYGRKKEVLPIQIQGEELTEALRHRSRMFELALGLQKDFVLLKELQYDAFGDEVVHADFVRVAMDETLRLEVPIQLKGAPKLEHAVLQQTLAQVQIECLPKDIPEAVIAQVAEMTVGQSMHVRELVVPPGVKILTDPEVIVATVTAVLEEVPVAAAPTAEAVTGEPEVIGRKVELEEGEEEEAAPGKPEKPEKKEKEKK